jgi:hypothetical protein
VRRVFAIFLSFFLALSAQATEPGVRSSAESSLAVVISPYVDWSFAENFSLELNSATGKAEFCLKTNEAINFYQIRTSVSGLRALEYVGPETLTGCDRWSFELGPFWEQPALSRVTLLLEPAL